MLTREQIEERRLSFRGLLLLSPSPDAMDEIPVLDTLCDMALRSLETPDLGAVREAADAKRALAWIVGALEQVPVPRHAAVAAAIVHGRLALGRPPVIASLQPPAKSADGGVG